MADNIRDGHQNNPWLWGGVAALAAKNRGKDALPWAIGGMILGPALERVLGFSLHDTLVALQAQAEAEERQRRWAALQEAIRRLQATPVSVPSGAGAPIILPPLAPSLPLSAGDGPGAPAAEPDARWRQVIVHPSVVLILGKRGSGKSALGYRLLELFRYALRPYVVGVPESARRVLPEWIGIAPTLEDVPPKSIALVDEAYLAYHARGSMARESRAMSQALNLSRQREQTLVFVSQEARQIDKNIASSANMVVFKDLSIIQLEFERRELNKLAGQAREAFSKVTGDKRRWTFVYAPDTDFVGPLENAMASFWKPSLSRLFAAEAAPAAPRKPERLTPQEKAAKAKAMREQGASLKQIAEALGVTRSSVVNYLRAYPYRRVPAGSG